MGSRTGFGDDRVVADDAPARGPLREYAEIMLVCVIFVMFLRTFVFQQSEIPSASMEDAILPGDYIIVNRFAYAPTRYAWERALLPVGRIERGDVVVFKHPPGPERDFIKRVAGLPGDVVELRRGVLWVNGTRVEEPWLNPLYRGSSSLAPTRVPEGAYFMLGDHRNLSADSREWGVVEQSLVKGQALMILFSTPAAEGPEAASGKVTVRSIFRKLVGLLFDARWDRAFRAIQ